MSMEDLVGEHRDGALWYPEREGDPNYPERIKVELYDVRAADYLMVAFDFPRNGWVLSLGDSPDVERAFVPAWIEDESAPAPDTVPEEVQYALDYARHYWHHGQEPQTQRALHVLASWIEGMVREALSDLLAALPPDGHTCFRPQGCVACGRAKERNDARALVIRKLDALDGSR